MSSVPHAIQSVENRVDSHASRSAAGSSVADVPLFRYRLRQLLAFVAAICALLTTLDAMSGLAAAMFLLATSVVAMHVFATTLGSRLQARADDEQRSRTTRFPESQTAASDVQRSASLAAIQSAPRSPWHGRGSTYLPWLPRLILGAMVVGGIAGASLLNATIGHRASPAGIIVGAISFAVVGGWFAFLCGNFYGVFRHGFREALAEQKKDSLRSDQR